MKHLTLIALVLLAGCDNRAVHIVTTKGGTVCAVATNSFGSPRGIDCDWEATRRRDKAYVRSVIEPIDAKYCEKLLESKKADGFIRGNKFYFGETP